MPGMPSMSLGISRPCQCIENPSGSRFSTINRTRSPSLTWIVGPGTLPLKPQASTTRPGTNSVRTCSAAISNTFTSSSRRHGMSGTSGVTTGTTPGTKLVWRDGTGGRRDARRHVPRRGGMLVLSVGVRRRRRPCRRHQTAKKVSSFRIHGQYISVSPCVCVSAVAAAGFAVVDAPILIDSASVFPLGISTATRSPTFRSLNAATFAGLVDLGVIGDRECQQLSALGHRLDRDGLVR